MVFGLSRGWRRSISGSQVEGRTLDERCLSLVSLHPVLAICSILRSLSGGSDPDSEREKKKKNPFKLLFLRNAKTDPSRREVL